MDNTQPTTELVFRIATPEDIAHIDYLDSLSASPTRHIHREMHKYFGSIDPSTHERTLIFLLQIEDRVAGKAELMIPASDDVDGTGYIKRVIVHPDYRGQGLAKKLLDHVIEYARGELHLKSIDLHVWDQNTSAIKLYEHLGFELQHRELYYRLPL
jgi:ribosomal protein S18 acetylase RimI-like enzyme